MKRGRENSPERAASPLFNLNLRRSEPPRRWRNVVQRDRYSATLDQSRDTEESDDLGVELMGALRAAIEEQVQSIPNIQPHHMVHFTMQSDHFSHAFQSTTFTVEEFRENSNRLQAYMQSLAEKLNSNEEFEADDTFTVDMTVVRTPGVGGRGDRDKRRRLGRSTLETMLKTKRSVVEIKNKDQLCCARALVTMKARLDVKDAATEILYKNLRKGCPIQTTHAKALHAKAGVKEGPCGVAELDAFQKILPDCQIKVLSVDRPYMIIFKGPPSPKQLLLIKADQHYHGCTSFSGFLDRSYYCHQCDRGYNTEDFKNHPCEGRCCPSCLSLQCKDYLEVKKALPAGSFPNPSLPCDKCGRRFFGTHCMADHLKQTSTTHSLCEINKKCPSCKKVYEARPLEKRRGGPIPHRYRHRCGWAECPFCEKQVDQNTHKCFIQKVDPDDDEPKYKVVSESEVEDRTVVGVTEDGSCWVAKNTPLFVYADYEAVTDENGLQEPILVCCETEEDDECQVFYGRRCTDALFDFLDDLTVDKYGDDRKVIVLFHNFKGYDGMFVLKYLYDNHRTVEDQVTIGTKVLSLRNGDITFKDSLCFLPFPLASFPSTFGLTEQCKGFFPHLFNTMANQRYVGPIPDRRFYDPEGMKEKKKSEFLTWHDQQVRSDREFNLREEMEAYCESDVKLLKAGCQSFQKQFETHAGFKPMEKCITIASACNRFWRKKLLPTDTIAVEPPRGWFGVQTNTSIQAREWLAYENHLLRLQKGETSMQADRIRTSTNGGEVRVFTPAQSYLVDGFDAETNTIYEFNGCLWHGCPACFPRRNAHSKLNRDRTYQEMYEATNAKKALLKHEGYFYNSMWSCQWEWLKKNNDMAYEFMQEWKAVNPLNPRDAFFGGRTNAVKLYHKVDVAAGEVIFYVDVTSLYPWVNATAEYPIGHPEVITNPENQDISNYFGVALVDVIPPYNLYHPVLPHRQGGKLTFPLCSKCVQEEMKKPFLERSRVCAHSDEERTLQGTWCTPELVKAVAMGYRVTRIHEVWHFAQRTRGLFKPYVQQWLKIKQESSGYPSWADSEEKKREYRESYRDHEGIELDVEKIEKNPGRKATAKLMLNSFWGKFGENLNKTKVHSISDPASLFQLLSEPTMTTEHIRVCTEDLLEVCTKELTDNQLDNGKRNIFVAAFTTCHARLKLYEYLDLLKEQVLYFDTDSVVYRWCPGQAKVPLGDFLGEMTDELEGGDHITEFVSGGPKNYGYVTSSGKVCCKVRGFTLNARGSAQLNYEVMKQNVIAELQDPLDSKRLTDVRNPHFFTRHPTTKAIKVIPRTKQYGLVFDKRVVDVSTFASFPYGYQSYLDEADNELADLLLQL